MNVLREYGVEPRDIRRLSGGLVNKTWKVDTFKKSYILQEIADVFKESSTEQYDAVSRKLFEGGVLSPKVLPTKDGKLETEVEVNKYRLLSYIDNDKVYHIGRHAFGAGNILGKFHDAMEGFEPVMKIDNFHDTPYYVSKLEQIHPADCEKKVSDTIDFYLRETPKLYLPDDLPQIVLHGDPKVDNILFKHDYPVAIIDFETVMKGPELLDLGDMLRSVSCSKSYHFNDDAFSSAVSGYKESRGMMWSDSALKDAMRLISLELGTRFMIDYFEDSYFGWNPEEFPTRKDANLARAEGLINFYRESF